MVSSTVVAIATAIVTAQSAQATAIERATFTATAIAGAIATVQASIATASVAAALVVVSMVTSHNVDCCILGREGE